MILQRLIRIVIMSPHPKAQRLLRSWAFRILPRTKVALLSAEPCLASRAEEIQITRLDGGLTVSPLSQNTTRSQRSERLSSNWHRSLSLKSSNMNRDVITSLANSICWWYKGLQDAAAGIAKLLSFRVSYRHVLHHTTVEVHAMLHSPSLVFLIGTTVKVSAGWNSIWMPSSNHNSILDSSDEFQMNPSTTMNSKKSRTHSRTR